MIVALLNQEGGVGKTPVALHLAGQWARQGKWITLIEADPQGSALDWSEQRGHRRFDRLFSVTGLAHDTLHREAPGFARHSDHVVIDGPPRAALLRSAPLTADLALIPAPTSPFDGLESPEALALIADAGLPHRLVFNRYPTRTIIVRETAQSRAESDPPAHQSDCVRTPQQQSCRLRDRCAVVPNRQAIAMTTRGGNRGFAAPPRDAESCIRTPDQAPSGEIAADLHTARLTVTSRRRSVGASRSPPSSAASPPPACCADLLVREFPYPDGGHP